MSNYNSSELEIKEHPDPGFMLLNQLIFDRLQK